MSEKVIREIRQGSKLVFIQFGVVLQALLSMTILKAPIRINFEYLPPKYEISVVKHQILRRPEEIIGLKLEK